MREFEKVEMAGGRAVLYRADCLEVLAAGLLKCDAVVTDPPYGIGYQHSGHHSKTIVNSVGKTADGSKARVNTTAIFGDDKPFNPEPWLSFDRVLLFGADKYSHWLPRYGSYLAWDKSCGVGPADSFCDAEFIWTSIRGVKRNVCRHLWKGIIGSGADSPTSGRRRLHPAQKPRELMSWCIQTTRPQIGGVVCDPYAGSGSTGIAALSLGYRFVGVEIDPGHFATACARIEAWWEEHGA